MGEEEILAGQGQSLAAPVILFIVTVFHFASRFLENLKKKGSRSDQEVQLRAQIKKLLKDASSLSQPSTFAQSAKLRRLAAAKEKELLKFQQENSKGLKQSYDLYLQILFIAKVVIYFILICWFWRTPVAAISQQLVQPFGRMLSLSSGGTSESNVKVGIIPWLILSTRVSKFVVRILK